MLTREDVEQMNNDILDKMPYKYVFDPDDLEAHIVLKNMNGVSSCTIYPTDEVVHNINSWLKANCGIQKVGWCSTKATFWPSY